MSEEEGDNRTVSDRQKQKGATGAHWRAIKSRMSSNRWGNKILKQEDTWSASWGTHWSYLETGKRSLVVFFFLNEGLNKILSLWLAQYLGHNIWVPGIDTETTRRIKTKWFLLEEKSITLHQHFLTGGTVDVPSYLPASVFTALCIIENMENYIIENMCREV